MCLGFLRFSAENESEPASKNKRFSGSTYVSNVYSSIQSAELHMCEVLQEKMSY